ncbi:guanylate cyclase domain-containing protein, partial [Haematococcus lacustris]
MSSQVPEQLRSATYNLIAFIGSPGVLKQVLQIPLVLAAPFRSSGLLSYQAREASQQSGESSAPTSQAPLLDPMQQPGLNAWRSQGYNYSDVVEYNGALLQILQLPGTAMDIRFAWQQDPLKVLQNALTTLLTTTTSQVSGSAGGPSTDTTAVIAATMDAMTAGLRLVRSPGLSKRETSIVIAVSVVVCCLVLGLLGIITAHWRRNARLQRSLMGHVLPPAAGDTATLVITDVQGSSKLWVRPGLYVALASIRRLAQDHAGYEFGTEGDSFLLCFHTAAAAVRFAIQLQEALLLCTTWPAELQVAGSPGLPLYLAPEHTGTSKSSSGSAPQHSFISLASAATTWNGHDRASPPSYRASALLSRTAKSLKVLRFGPKADERSRVSSQSRVDLAQEYSRHSGEGSASQPASRSGNGAAAVGPEHLLQQRLNPVFSVGKSHHSTSSATSAHQVQPTASHPSTRSINIELVTSQPQQAAPGRSIAVHAVEGLLGLFAHQPTARPAGPLDGKLSTVVSSKSSICPPQDQVGSSSGAATTSQLDLSTASHSALGQGRVGWQQLCAMYREVGPEAPAALM